MVILNLFWNSKDHRLRAFWRLVIQALFMLLTSSALTFVAGLAISNLSLGGELTTGTGNPLSLSDRLMVALQTTGWTQVLLAVITLIAVLLSLLFAARILDRRPWAAYGFHFQSNWWRDLGFGLVLGAGLMTLIFIFESILGWITITGTVQPARSGEPFWIGLFQALILFLCVGIYEEAISRGYQLRNLAEGLNLSVVGRKKALWFSFGLSAFIFGLLHITNPFSSGRSTVGILLAGLFLGLGYLLTGELAISVGIHITWNFFEGNVFGFPVSGTQFGSSFLTIRQTGPEGWTGGAFGPEAGLIGLLAIILGMGLTVAWVYRTRKKVALVESLAEYQGPGPSRNQL